MTVVVAPPPTPEFVHRRPAGAEVRTSKLLHELHTCTLYSGGEEEREGQRERERERERDILPEFILPLE